MTAPDPEAPVLSTLSILLSQRRTVLLRNVEKWLRTGDPESLHDIRVNARRLMHTMRAFRDILPRRGRRFETGLKRLVEASGRLRELDVFLASLREFRDVHQNRDHRGVAFLEAGLSTARAQNARRMIAVVKKKEFDDGFPEFLSSLR